MRLRTPKLLCTVMFWASVPATEKAYGSFPFTNHTASGSATVQFADGGPPVSGSASTDSPTDTLMELTVQDPPTQPQVKAVLSSQIFDEGGLEMTQSVTFVLCHWAIDTSSPGGTMEGQTEAVFEFVLPSTAISWRYGLNAAPGEFTGSGHLKVENVTQSTVLLDVADQDAENPATPLGGSAGDLIRVMIEASASIIAPPTSNGVPCYGVSAFALFTNVDDCNANGVSDHQDVLSGTGADCTNNGILDQCDIASGTEQDCTGDGIPDECQDDCNNNGVADPCDIAAQTSEDCNANGTPDECDLAAGTSPDCNINAVPDECDIASGSSFDCNNDQTPDDCQPHEDCNSDSVPDGCDIASGFSDDCNNDEIPDDCQPDEDCNGNGTLDLCDIGSGTSADCNVNLSPDECDLAAGLSPDANGNNVPDECDVVILAGNDVCWRSASSTGVPCSGHGECTGTCIAGSNPGAPCTGPNVGCMGGGRCNAVCGTKNRYLSIVLDDGNVGPLMTALQVKVVDVPASLASQEALMEGDIWWAGPPSIVSEGPGTPATFKGVMLECTATPHFRDWAAEGLIHLYGAAVIPQTSYEVRICSLTSVCGEPVRHTTVAENGDVVSPFSAGFGQPNFSDISTMVYKFQNRQNATSKTRTQMMPNALNPSASITFQDISYVVGAFAGFPYPLPGASCP